MNNANNIIETNPQHIRVVFMGTPEFAAPVLEALIKNTRVVQVVSQPDRKVGRNRVVEPTPVKKVAQAFSIPVFQPNNIKDKYSSILTLKPDIIVTCAYGQIIPKELLEYPRLGCINVHASLLPKLRGGAPIHHAIIDGYDKTGITIMYMDEKMDTGDIIAQREYIIKDTDNVETLHNELSRMGKELLLETLPSIVNGTNNRTPQNQEEATYAWNIKREEEHIDYNKTASAVRNQIRGLYPWPTANSIIMEQEVKILDCYISDEESKFSPGTICAIKKDAIGISTKDKVIYVTKVKPFGKKEMSARDYINGLDKEKVIYTIAE